MWHVLSKYNLEGNATFLKRSTTGDGWFVSAQTGEIFGQFSSTGAHSMTLVAVDSAGKQATVEKMTFDVTDRPVFDRMPEIDPLAFTRQQVGLRPRVPSESSTDAESGDDSTAPPLVAASPPIQYAVGSTIKFPPMEKAASEVFVNPAFDDFAKITYKRTFGASTAATNPGLWLVDTETAEMLAQPTNAGNYSVSLVATDGAGAEAILRSWSFEVLLKDTDVPEHGPNGKDCTNGGTRVDDAGAIFDRQFQCGCEGTGYYGSNCETKIVPAVCNPNEALVGEACKPFQLATSPDGVRTADGAVFTNPTSMERKFYTVSEFASYRVAPLAIDDARTNYSSGNQSGVSYTMRGDTDGFFLNTKTGQMLGTFANFADEEGDPDWGDKSATKQFGITLQAIDGSGVHQDMETMVMNVRYPDLEVAAYGPNGKPCANNGTRMDGADGAGDPFDQSYVCKCIADGTTSYSGDNCEVALEASSGSAGDGASGNTSVVAGGMAGAVAFIFCVGLIFSNRRMHKLKMKAFDFKAEIERLVTAGEIDEGAEDGGDSGPRIPREIKRSHLTMVEQIGEGAFGDVWRGVLDESSAGGVPGYTAAVKTSKEAKGEGADEMLREATVMAQVSGHPNLVSLIGVVTSGVPLLLAISMCENGSLLSLLKGRKLKGRAEGKVPFTLADRIGFAVDTAKGMAHLTAFSFVHRDLAARNVLVDALMNCKVADFGLARGIAGARAGPDTTNDDGSEEEYYRSRTGTFPVRWTSPEAMQTMRFSEATDVWSFAVTLVEVFTDGGKPYAGMANAAVITKVQGGYRAEQPKLCTDEMYAVLLACWDAKPAERPTFAKLAALLEAMAASPSSRSVAAAAAAASAGSFTETSAAGPRHAVVVNDTYATDDAGTTVPAVAEDGDQYLTVNNTAGADARKGTTQCHPTCDTSV